MKLSKNQKEKLWALSYSSWQNLNHRDNYNWWISQIEELKPAKDFELFMESKYSTQEIEEKECDEERCYCELDCEKIVKPNKRIEEIDYEASQLYGEALKDKINQIIRKLNNL